MIIVKDLHKKFEDNHVLQGVNYHIHPGEKIVVVGPSGSGKSTLAKTILFLSEFQTFFYPRTIARRLQYTTLSRALHTCDDIHSAECKISLLDRAEVLYKQTFHCRFLLKVGAIGRCCKLVSTAGKLTGKAFPTNLPRWR